MKKFNRLSVLLTCLLLALALAGSVAFATDVTTPDELDPVMPEITITPVSGLTYNGQAQTIAQVSVTPAEADVNVTVSGASYAGGVVTATNAGSYTISVTASTGENTTASSSSTATIAKANATITPSDGSRMYRASGSAPTAAVTGLVGSDTLSYKLSVVDTDGKTINYESDAGSYKVKVKLVPSAVHNNYNITCGEGTFTITKRPVTITAPSKTIAYGETAPEPTAYTDYEGVTHAYTVSYDGAVANQVPAAGTYAIVVGNTDSKNFDYTVKAGTLTVKPITGASVKAPSASITYGDAIPALNGTVDGEMAGTPVNYTIQVQKNGAAVSGTLDCDTYDVVVVLGDNGNYDDITTTKGTLTVSPKAVTVTADSKTMTYGDAVPEITASVSGAVEGCNVVYTVAPAEELGTCPDADTYDLVVTADAAANPNYTVTVAKGTLTVSPKAVTVTANNVQLAYGDNAPETFDATVEGAVEGCDVVYTVAPAEALDAVPAAGTYDLVVTADAAANPNYTVTAVNGKLTVGKTAVTVTAADVELVYGDEVPAFTATVEGAVEGCEVVYTVAPAVELGDRPGVGTYELVVTANEADNPNYAVTVVPGKLTISKRDVTITADNATRVYGNSLSSLNATVEGALDGETLTYEVVADGVNRTTDVGEYAIVVELIDSDVNANYEIVTVDGVLTITKRDATVTVFTKRVTYGDAVPEAAVSEGTRPAVLAELVYEVKTVDANGAEIGDKPDAGEYAYVVEFTEEDNKNYNITTKTGKLIVLPRNASVTANDATVVYGDAVPAPTVTLDNVVEGDELDYEVLYVVANTDTEIDAQPLAGEYDVVVKLGENPNYDLPVTRRATLTVTKRPVTVTVADVPSRYYGEANPEFTSGVENMAYTDQLTGEIICQKDGADVNEETPIGTYDVEYVLGESEVHDNYEVTIVNKTMEILPRPVKIVLSDVTLEYHSTAYDSAVVVNGSDVTMVIDHDAEVQTNAGLSAAMANGEQLSYTIHVNNPQLDAEGVLLPGSYALTVSVNDSAVHANYDIAIEDDGVLTMVSYDQQGAIDFTTQPAEDANGWYNSDNPARLEAPEGYTIYITADTDAKVSNKVEGAASVEMKDSNGNTISYFLENTATGARTATYTLTYKQDTVAPVVGDGYEYINVFITNGYRLNVSVDGDKACYEGSRITSVELKEKETGDGAEYVKHNDCGWTVESGNTSVTHSEMVREVLAFRLVVSDEAGNTTVVDLNGFTEDTDHDGLNNLFEVNFGSNANKADTDDDGLNDYYEEMSGFSDLRKVDTDNDTVDDMTEKEKGLNAKKEDSDNDGINDATYLAYLEMMGMDDMDMVLGMKLLQNNLTDASCQKPVPAAELTMMADTMFWVDNGEDEANSYTDAVNDTGSIGSINSNQKQQYMILFNEADGTAVYIGADKKGVRYLVYAKVNRSKLDAQYVVELPFAADVDLAVATSADGTIVALAPWADGATTENVLLIDLNAGKQFRFGNLADTVGATRFALAQDGSELAYVAKDGTLYTIGLTEENYGEEAYSGNALYYTAEGDIVTNVDETSANGVYHIAQPTLSSATVLMVKDGEATTIVLNGRFYVNGNALLYQAPNMRASGRVSLQELYKNMTAAN